MNDFAAPKRHSEDEANAECALSTLKTIEQKGVFCNYLINSTLPTNNLAAFSINNRLFSEFVRSAESLSVTARLSLAISLLGDVLMIEQERTSLANLKRYILQPTLHSREKERYE